MKVNRLVILLAVFFLAISAHAQAKKPISKQGLVNAVKINGLHYYDVGDRNLTKALVLVHGWTCNADFWNDSLKAFPEYRVIAVDLPGHGQSDKPKTTYSMEYFAKSVATVMDNAGVKKAVIVGHSMGMPVAREFYRLFPERTLGIVNVDGALKTFFPKATMDQFIAQMRADYKGNSAKFVDGMLTPVKDERLKLFIRDSMLATPDYVAISAFESMSDEKIWGDDKINVPLLAVMAPSPFWPPNVKESFAEVAPKMDFQMWSGVSHFLFMEKPTEFNEAVRSFVARNKLL